jgi:hypothetical protein
MTPSKVASAIKAYLKDINDFPGTSGDSPLKIGTSKTIYDATTILKLDAKLRVAKAKVDAIANYKVPEVRTVVEKTLESVFSPLVNEAIASVSTVKSNIDNDSAMISDLEVPAEILEFTVQLFSGFKSLLNPKVYQISTIGEYDTLFIIGEVLDTLTNTNVSVIASTLLINDPNP